MSVCVSVCACVHACVHAIVYIAKCVCACVRVCVCVIFYHARMKLFHYPSYIVICIMVSVYKRTVMNGTSPRQFPVHILM